MNIQTAKNLPLGTELDVRGRVEARYGDPDADKALACFVVPRTIEAFVFRPRRGYFVGLRRRNEGALLKYPDAPTEFRQTRTHMVVQWRESPTSPIFESLPEQVETTRLQVQE